MFFQKNINANFRYYKSCFQGNNLFMKWGKKQPPFTERGNGIIPPAKKSNYRELNLFLEVLGEYVPDRLLDCPQPPPLALPLQGLLHRRGDAHGELRHSLL